MSACCGLPSCYDRLSLCVLALSRIHHEIFCHDVRCGGFHVSCRDASAHEMTGDGVHEMSNVDKRETLLERLYRGPQAVLRPGFLGDAWPIRAVRMRLVLMIRPSCLPRPLLRLQRRQEPAASPARNPLWVSRARTNWPLSALE